MDQEADPGPDQAAITQLAESFGLLGEVVEVRCTACVLEATRQCEEEHPNWFGKAHVRRRPRIQRYVDFRVKPEPCLAVHGGVPLCAGCLRKCLDAATEEEAETGV